MKDKIIQVSKAVAKQDFVPSYQKIWFINNNLFVFNGLFGVFTNQDYPHFFGVQGEDLASIIKTYSNPELSVQEGNLYISNVQSTTTLPITPAELNPLSDSFFIPNENNCIIKDTNKFFNALSHVLKTAQHNTQAPSRDGVTFLFLGNTLTLYSTNNEVIAEASINISERPSEDLDQFFSLSLDFCKYLISFKNKVEQDISITFDTDKVFFDIDEYIVFCGYNETTPADYLKVTQNLKESVSDTFTEIDEALSDVLNRSKILYKTYGTCTIYEEQGVTKILTDTLYGTTVDVIDLNISESDKIQVNPTLIHKYMKNLDYIAVSKSCTVLTNENKDIYYYMSNIKG